MVFFKKEIDLKKKIFVRSLRLYINPIKNFIFKFNLYKDIGCNEIQLNIFKIKNVIIASKSCLLAIDQKNLNWKDSWKFIIEESANHCLEESLAKEKFFLNQKIKKKISFKQPVFVVNNPATRNNYGHFLYEVYLKILTILFSKLPKPIFLYTNETKKSELQHMKILKQIFGIKLKKINFDLPSQIQSDCYILNSLRFIGGDFVKHPAEFFKNIPKILLNNNKFKKKFKKKQKRIFLISRTDTRIINNISEIKNKIPEIEIINISNTSSEKQIEVFYNAKAIIASFGASLVNLIFSQQKTQLIYLRPKNFLQYNSGVDEYTDMAKSLNIKTHILKCDVIKDKNGKILKKIPRIDNNNNILETPDGSYFNVNVNKLKKFVGKIK